MQLRATFLTKQKICEKGEVRQVISHGVDVTLTE